MTVAQRLYVLIFATAVGLVGLAGFGIIEMAKVYDAANFANINTVPSILTLDKAFTPFSRLRAQTWQYLALSDPAQRSELAKAMDEQHAQGIAALNEYEKEEIADDKDRSLLSADRNALAEYDALREKILTLTNTNQTEEARNLLLASKVTINKLVEAIEEHRQYNAKLGKQGDESAAATLIQTRWTMVIIAFLVIAAVVGMGLMLVRSLLRQLGGEPAEVVEIAGKIASGDLAVSIETKSNDQSSLLQAIRAMRDSLAAIVTEVRTGTEMIATSSGQIASGNLDLSSRTEEQASSLEETASSMEELTSTVKQNADNARQANVLALSASEVAVKGGAVVSQVVETMSSINDSAKKIVDIIGVIDGIAFQTNILALNAAVEAARAGEQGRGFAVVATEVRNLAQRSAAAAKEIKTLIGDSVEKVDAGSKLVDQAGATMHAVVNSIKQVADIMGEITAASQEQTAGIEQVNQAISQMDQVTQQNASLVEEAAAAAESMQEQAGNLVQVVSIFKLTAKYAVATSGRVKTQFSAKASVTKLDKIMGSRRAIVTNSVPHSQVKRVTNATSGASNEWEEF